MTNPDVRERLIRKRPVTLCISASEAAIYNDDKLVKNLGFVGGATIEDINGNTIADVNGSDEYNFEIKNIIHYRVTRKSRYNLRQVIAIMR